MKKIMSMKYIVRGDSFQLIFSFCSIVDELLPGYFFFWCFSFELKSLAFWALMSRRDENESERVSTIYNENLLFERMFCRLRVTTAITDKSFCAIECTAVGRVDILPVFISHSLRKFFTLRVDDVRLSLPAVHFQFGSIYYFDIEWENIEKESLCFKWKSMRSFTHLNCPGFYFQIVFSNCHHIVF